MSIEKRDIGTANVIEGIVNHAERVEAKCRYRVDAHSKASARWALAHYLFSIPLITLSALVSLAAFKKIFEKNEIMIGVLAITVSILSALITFLNPVEKSKNHHSASVEYDALKDKARHLGNIEAIRLTSPTDLSNKLSHLLDLKHEIDKRSPEVKKLSPRAVAAMTRLRTLIYGSGGRKRRSRRV